MTTHDDQAPPLPGLGDLSPSDPDGSRPLIRSLRRTIAALEEAGVLEEEHALPLEAMHLLARSAEKKFATGRMSTLAGDIELLLKIKDSIVGEDGEVGVDEQLRAAMEEFERKLAEAGS